MVDASVRASERDGYDSARRVSSVTGGFDPESSTTTGTNGAHHKPLLGLPNDSFERYNCNEPLPISITTSGYAALRAAEAEEDLELVCQHELGVVRGRLECLNCGQLKVSFSSGGRSYSDKRS